MRPIGVSIRQLEKFVIGSESRSRKLRDATGDNPVSASNGNFQPKPEHKFSFGLWTVGNRGRDPFGDFVRPEIPPNDIVAMLAEVGAWGVNLHDNDLVPIDAPPAQRDRIVSGFKKACEKNKLKVPMATV